MRRALFLFLAATLAFGSSGCASITSSESPAMADTPLCPHTKKPLSELELVRDIRTVIGPSTACLAADTITPVPNSSSPDLPATVTDSEGRTVTVRDVSRVLPVDISGTIASTVFALGFGDVVVGRDASTDFTGTETLPVVTKAGHTLNAEAILELAPTVMLTDTTIGPKEVRQQLRDAGVAVVVISSERRLDNTAELVTEIADALGVPARGASLNMRLDVELAKARAQIAAVTPTDPADRARMLFLYVRGNANVYYLFGRGSGADSLIDAVGGIDVATEIGWEGMKPMNAEALVAAKPDVLVMMTDGLASMGGVDGLLASMPAVAETPAGAHRRVIDMADTQVLSFGPRSAEILLALARALYAPSSHPASDVASSPDA